MRQRTPDGDVLERVLVKADGLDIPLAHPDALVVAATEGQLAELERRKLAEVERWSTREEYVSRLPDTD